MLRKFVPIMTLLVFTFSLGGTHVSAQDATPEVTPVVIVTPAPVATPAPILTPDNAISVSTILYGLIIAVLGGGTVGFVLNKFGSNKTNQDALEKLYLSLSPDAQTNIRHMFESVQEINVRLLDLVDKVTDGKPNEEPPAVG